MSDGWILHEQSPFEIARAKGYEGVFTLGSGYLHVRGSLEEHLADAPQNVSYMRRPANVTAETFPYMPVKWGVFVPGIYGLHPLMGKELANLPSFLSLTPSVNGEKLDLQHSRVEDYQRQLNFKTAILSRSLTWITQQGATIQVEYQCFVSAADPHLCVQQLTLTSDQTVDCELSAGIDADVRTSGYDHFTQVEFSQVEPNHIRCVVTLDTGSIVTQQTALLLNDAKWTYHPTARQATLSTTHTLQAGTPIKLEKRTALITDFDREPLIIGDLLKLETPAEALQTAHEAVWKTRWDVSDVLIEGDEESQLAMRLSLYHLLRAHPNDSRFAIDPKAYAGDAYRGLYFWDTEMYLLPFFLYTDPDRARMLTDFRINTLKGAQINAQEYGYEGARYPWEGDIDGIDQCPAWQYRDHEVHVTADVVYGFLHYSATSNQPSYVDEDAREVILETAKYWLDRVDTRAEDHAPSLLGVMGPDEYTPITQNNAYTNRLVSMSLATASALSENHDFASLCAYVAQSLPILKRADGLVLQCEEFERLADLDIEYFWRDRSRPFASQVSQERIYRSKCMKQADVLLLMMLFPHEFTDAEVAKAWEYYLPFTTHDSSLSPGVHAVIALRLGLHQPAWDFWQRSYGIDLHGGAEEGLHIAALGMNWQIAVFGFAGVQTAMVNDTLTLNPRLPSAWKRLAFPLLWKGQSVFIDIHPDDVTVTNRSPQAMPIQVFRQSAILASQSSLTFQGPHLL